MSLPVKTDLETMDYTFNGEPFVDVPGNSSITLSTMDYTFMGEPFVRNEAGGTVTAAPRRTLLGCGN